MPQGRKIETATLEELFSSNTSGTFPVLVDVRHDALKWDDDTYEQEDGHLRLINDQTAVRFGGKKYLPSYFSFTMPQEDGTKIGQTSITISAVDQRIIELIRSIKTRPILVIEALFAKPSENTFAFSRIYHYEFEAKSVNWDDTTAKWDLVFDPTGQMNIPKDLGTMTRCPGILQQ